MQVTIDSVGRLVIPKQLRGRFGLDAGTAVELEAAGDHIEMRPAGRHVRIETGSGRPVARATGDVPLLTAADVRRLIEDARR